MPTIADIAFSHELPRVFFVQLCTSWVALYPPHHHHGSGRFLIASLPLS